MRTKALHDDVIKWKPFPRFWPLCGEFTGDWWIPLTKASNAELWCFLWSSPWKNGWVNNREAGDLRRHRAHYDAIVMISVFMNIETNTKTTLDCALTGRQFVHMLSLHYHKWRSLLHFSHIHSVWLAWFTFCWWRHNQSIAQCVIETDNGYADTWKMTSHSLDISFIQGDILGRW